MATLISQFELIFKKQAPINGVELETVLQGYFMQLTNLEEKNLLFNIDFVSQMPSNNDTGGKLDSNTLAILDNPGAPVPNNVFSQLQILPATNNTYRAPGHTYDIAAGATALLTVIPQVVKFPGVDETPVGRDIEIRGYVQISLPVLKDKAQISKPADIMVTPQNRASFFTFPSDDTFDDGIIKNQVQATLTTSTGGAVLQVEPDSPPA
ncbi:hypothetical protein OAM69_03660 [bacterium]|nr:hypothetical protein [bacterium]